MNAINIDLLPTYSGAIEKILEKRSLGRAVLQECRKSAKNYSNFRLALIGGEGRKTEVTKEARNLLIQELPKQFQYITAFHGCRVYEPKSYRRDGILVCEPKKLLQWAIQYFGWKKEKVWEALDRLKQDCSDYLEHNAGKVYAVKSMMYYMEEENGFCHTKGSELLSCMASQMKPNRKEDLYRKGEPSIIKFRIPIQWMKKRDWENYVDSLFVHYISHLVPYYAWSGGNPREGGEIINRSIPSEHLVCRYLCDKGGRAEKLVEVYN